MTLRHDPRIVVGLFSSADSPGFLAKSRAQPDTLFIDVGGKGALVRNGVLVRAPLRTRQLLAACFAIPERIIARAELIEILWGGGPDRADAALDQALAGARVAGAALGIVLNVHYGRGVSARLQRAEAGR